MNNINFDRFKTISFIEGLSFLILLFIAMPLKYFVGLPIAVKIVGMAHGVLFILFCIFLYKAMKEDKWKIESGVLVFISSLIPFGFIPIEKTIMKIHNKEI